MTDISIYYPSIKRIKNIFFFVIFTNESVVPIL